MNALANDNWIGRMPFALAPAGELLGDKTLKTLALGRICVNKIIAEPEKPDAKKFKQGGIRGNSIVFPQAKLELLGSSELPAPHEKAIKFLSESVTIALAGVGKDQLRNAKMFEIQRQQYIDAARCLTAHNMAYIGDGVTLNEERADQHFAARGQTSAAVEEQMVSLDVDGAMPHRMEGPADTGCAGCAGAETGNNTSDQIVAVDGKTVEEQTEEEAVADLNAALPDEDHPQEVLPAMNFCADDAALTLADEVQAIQRVSQQLHHLRDVALAGAEEDDAARRPVRSHIYSLQTAVKALTAHSFTDRIEQADAEITASENRIQNQNHPCSAYKLHTGSKPLSMYSATTWAKCFPHLFPYGDGVFGLPRQKPMTFQQHTSMLYLREELRYEVTPDLMTAARKFFGDVDAPVDGRHGQQEEAQDRTIECQCLQCTAACNQFHCPPQPRWGRDREFLCCAYDSWRRMEQIRRARTHVRRNGYKQKLEKICNASAEKVFDNDLYLKPRVNIIKLPSASFIYILEIIFGREVKNAI